MYGCVIPGKELIHSADTRRNVELLQRVAGVFTVAAVDQELAYGLPVHTDDRVMTLERRCGKSNIVRCVRQPRLRVDVAVRQWEKIQNCLTCGVDHAGWDLVAGKRKPCERVLNNNWLSVGI